MVDVKWSEAEHDSRKIKSAGSYQMQKIALTKILDCIYSQHERHSVCTKLRRLLPG